MTSICGLNKQTIPFLGIAKWEILIRIDMSRIDMVQFLGSLTMFSHKIDWYQPVFFIWWCDGRLKTILTNGQQHPLTQSLTNTDIVCIFYSILISSIPKTIIQSSFISFKTWEKNNNLGIFLGNPQAAGTPFPCQLPMSHMIVDQGGDSSPSQKRTRLHTATGLGEKEDCGPRKGELVL